MFSMLYFTNNWDSFFWTRRILGCWGWGPSGTLLKEQASYNLVQYWGHRGPVLRPRCIGPGGARTPFIILFYSILFYSILFYSILLYSILFYSILLYSILSYSILLYSILSYSILLYSILSYSILLYSILFYSILFYSTLFYSILFYSTLFYSIQRYLRFSSQ